MVMSDYITPVMHIDSDGHSWEKFWTKAVASVAVIGIIVAVSLFFIPGCAAIGGLLLSTSIGSLIGGAQSVKNGGSFLAGAAGGSIIGLGIGLAGVFGGGLLLAASEVGGLLSVGTAVGGLALGFGLGYGGGYYGSKITQNLNEQIISHQSAVDSGLLFGGMGLISALGGGMANAVFSTVGFTETTYLAAGGFAATITIGVEIIIDTVSYLVELYSN